MIPWIAVAFLVVAFVRLLRAFKLVNHAKHVLETSRASLAVIKDPALDDDAKAQRLQRHSLTLLKLSAILTAGGAAAVLLPFGVVWLCSVAGLVALDEVLALAVSAPALIGATVIALVMLAPRRSRPKGDAARYSATDRLLHRIAFRTTPAQVAIADIEATLFGKQFRTNDAKHPVFITALPRAGTTLLLECCARLPDFAAHCYRDMPFVLTPCLWHRFAASFRRDTTKHPRSHGDGMLIDMDSPEALEEVLWLAFWRKQYTQDRILPWPASEPHPEFEAFLDDHMRKVILLRHGPDATGVRYVSKNNLNIARIPWLRQRFPEATIIIPFRDPLQHAASLCEQHRNFLKIHNEDPFAAEYMRAIGHFDFGQNLRPVDFDHWLDGRAMQDTTDMAFWLEYWIASYRHLLSAVKHNVSFLQYEQLCEAPDQGLHILAELTATQHADSLRATASAIHPVRQRALEAECVPEALYKDAAELHASLRDAALNT